jgi:hypothetical protein
MCTVIVDHRQYESKKAMLAEGQSQSEREEKRRLGKSIVSDVVARNRVQECRRLARADDGYASAKGCGD